MSRVPGGRGGRGRGPGRGGGRGRRAQEVTGLPRRSGEVGVCAELMNNVFTLSANNKAKDGDQLRKTKDAMSLYIGRIYGEECSKEFKLGTLNVRPLPIVNVSVKSRHAAKIAANTTRLQAKKVGKLSSLFILVEDTPCPEYHVSVAQVALALARTVCVGFSISFL